MTRSLFKCRLGYYLQARFPTMFMLVFPYWNARIIAQTVIRQRLDQRLWPKTELQLLLAGYDWWAAELRWRRYRKVWPFEDRSE